jgi:hypothetical protein
MTTFCGAWTVQSGVDFADAAVGNACRLQNVAGLTSQVYGQYTSWVAKQTPAIVAYSDVVTNFGDFYSGYVTTRATNVGTDVYSDVAVDAYLCTWLQGWQMTMPGYLFEDIYVHGQLGFPRKLENTYVIDQDIVSTTFTDMQASTCIYRSHTTTTTTMTPTCPAMSACPTVVALTASPSTCRTVTVTAPTLPQITSAYVNIATLPPVPKSAASRTHASRWVLFAMLVVVAAAF